MEIISKVKATYWGGMRKGTDDSKLICFSLLENGNVMYRYISSHDIIQAEITIVEEADIFFTTYGIKFNEI